MKIQQKINSIKHKIKKQISELYNKYKILFLFILIFILIYLLGQYIDSKYFELEYWGDKDNLNRAETIRNIGLVLLGIGAIIIALWRGVIANNELQNSNLKIDNEKFHKAVDLLESDSEPNRISALVMLSELIEKNDNFNEVIFQILSAYLKENLNIKKSFEAFDKKTKKLDLDEKVKQWYSREPITYSQNLCFQHYVSLLKKHTIKDLNQVVLFNNLDLHGVLKLDMPNGLIQNSDLSWSILYCQERTSFSNCDLSHSRVIPYKNNTLIFNHCNISNLRLEVSDDIEPIINGWHWENEVPEIDHYWGFPSFKSQRVIILSPERVIDSKLKKEYYSSPYDLKKPNENFLLSFGSDELKYDSKKQYIISEAEYNNLKNKKEVSNKKHPNDPL
ncbi:MAG: hypothetical protein KU38_06280 [Sulfurovum sp. FS08-3]|nr:MAG: hypothetical protein KU38_06280 [Sulfurovum sp. FS08-3]